MNFFRHCANKCKLAHVKFRTALWADIEAQTERESVFCFLYQKIYILFNIYFWKWHASYNLCGCLLCYCPPAPKLWADQWYILCSITYWVVMIIIIITDMHKITVLFNSSVYLILIATHEVGSIIVPAPQKRKLRHKMLNSLSFLPQLVRGGAGTWWVSQHSPAT